MNLISNTLGWNLRLCKRENNASVPYPCTSFDSSGELVLIRKKRCHSFQAQCSYWHENECFPLIMHQLNAECDPAWIFDCCACFPYLHISLTHYLHPSVFLYLLPFSLPIYRQSSGISPGRCSSINPKANSRSVCLCCPNLFVPPPLIISCPQKHRQQKYSSEIYWATLKSSNQFQPDYNETCTWRLTLWPPRTLPRWSWPLNFLLIMRLCPLIFSPGRCRKLALVTQWSMQAWRSPLMQSHGRLQGLMGACELYFLTNFYFPEAHDGFTRHAWNVIKCRTGLYSRQDYFV